MARVDPVVDHHSGRRPLRLEERHPAGGGVLGRHDRHREVPADPGSRQDPRLAAGRRRERDRPELWRRGGPRSHDPRPRGGRRVRGLAQRAGRRGRERAQHRRARADQRHVLAAEDGQLHLRHRDRRPDGRPRADAARHPGDGVRARRHPGLHRAPLPFELRLRRRHRDDPRPAHHPRIPCRLQVRDEPQRDRGAADDHRLLDERHHRHLRSRAREHALDAARAGAERDQRRGQPDDGPHRDHRRFDAARGDGALLLRRGSAQGLRFHDDRRHHHRHLLQRLHRRGDHRAVAEARAGKDGAGGGGRGGGTGQEIEQAPRVMLDRGAWSGPAE